MYGFVRDGEDFPRLINLLYTLCHDRRDQKMHDVVALLPNVRTRRSIRYASAEIRKLANEAATACSKAIPVMPSSGRMPGTVNDNRREPAGYQQTCEKQEIRAVS